jgi:sulfur carrier protein
VPAVLADILAGARLLARLPAYLRRPVVPCGPAWTDAAPRQAGLRSAGRAPIAGVGCIVLTAMKVVLRNQGREVELHGRRRVRELLAELGVLPETVLVIRGRDLLTIDEVVAEDDVLEVRPVISGGRA